MDNESKIFRKRSIDRINSPEQLNDYIRVVNINVWLVLAAIIILLTGVLIWGIFGQIQTSVDTVIVVDNSNATCYISTKDADRIENNMIVEFENTTATIENISDSPIQLDHADDDYALYLSELEEGDFSYKASLDTDIEDGVYEGKIIIEKTNPIKFITH